MHDIPVRVCGDHWLNPDEVRNTLYQIPVEEHIILDIGTEGPSLTALGLPLMLDELCRTTGRDPQTILRYAQTYTLLPAEDVDRLLSAHALMRDLMQWVRLTLGDDRSVTEASAGLKRQLAVTSGLPDFKVLASHLREEQQKVREIFERFMQG